jgi:hypothetical protein
VCSVRGRACGMAGPFIAEAKLDEREFWTREKSVI